MLDVSTILLPSGKGKRAKPSRVQSDGSTSSVGAI